MCDPSNPIASNPFASKPTTSNQPLSVRATVRTSHHTPRVTRASQTHLALHAWSFWVCITVMMMSMTTQDYADTLNASWRQFIADDAARAEARRDKDNKRYEEKLEKKDKECDEKLEKKEKYWEAKLEQKDKYWEEKVEKIKQEENIQKIYQECEEKLEKKDKECDEKLEKKDKECDEKLAKKDKECEELTKIQGVKIQKVQLWRKNNTDKFMNSGCDDPQVIATLAKNMGNTEFMTCDIVQDRVKLITINDWEVAAFAKRCAQVKENMEKINNKRTHDQIDSNTGASVAEI